MKAEIAEQVRSILAEYDPSAPEVAADHLRELWLRFEPKSMSVIKAEQRERQETIGIPVPILKAIGKEIGRSAHKRVDEYIPLARLLWDGYGREGRVVAVVPLGSMELSDPVTIIPLLMELCRSCVTWEDADHLAMNALEPMVRKSPEEWLGAMESWLAPAVVMIIRSGCVRALPP